MVLIAIDKHCRKILGYICRNNQNVAYCCSECDVECTTAKDLEEHMVIHENPLCIDARQAEENDTDKMKEDSVLLTASSASDRERQLKIKYQVTPCTVQLLRFNSDEEIILGAPTDNSLNLENIEPANKSPLRKRPSITSFAETTSPISIKKRKESVGHIKKIIKRKVPTVTAVCFLCGEKFQSTFALHQHEKTHLENGINTPVFPCKVCGKNVKNMKLHLRQHKIESKKATDMSFKGINTTEEASSSTDAVFTKIKASENGVTFAETTKESADPTTSHTRLCDDEFISAPISNEPTSSLCDIERPPSVLDGSSTLNYDSFNNSENIGNDSHHSVNTDLDSHLVFISNQNGHNENRQYDNNGPYDNMAIVETEHLEKTFQCSICARNFPSQLKLDKHKTLHDRKVPCEMCGKLVAMSYKRIHMKKYHIADTIDKNIPSYNG